MLVAANGLEVVVFGVDGGGGSSFDIGAGDAHVGVEALELGALVVAVEEVGFGDDAAEDNVI